MIKRDKLGRFMKTTKKAVACKGKCNCTKATPKAKTIKVTKSVKNSSSKTPAKKVAKKTTKKTTK